MRDIKSKPDCLSFSRPWVIGESSQTTSARCSPSTSVVHWQSGGEKWAECGGVSDWLVDDARKKRTDPGAGQSGPSTSSSCLGRQPAGRGEGGIEEADEEDWRATQRHPSPPRQNRAAWMVLKPAPVRQTCGNCASIKRFPDATSYTSNYRGNPPRGSCAPGAAHSILIGRLLRGYLYSAGSNFPFPRASRNFVCIENEAYGGFEN